MNSFILGAVGTIVALGLVVGGVFIGWVAHKKFTEKTKVAVESQYTEEQVKKMKEDKVAFETMLQYDAATAYNLNGDVEQLLKDDK